MIALKIILAVFIILLLTPCRSYPWAIAATLPVYTWLYWIISRPLAYNDKWGSIDRAIISMALLIGITPAIGRFLLGIRKGAMALPELDWTPAQASCVFVGIWGAAWLLTPEIPQVAGAGICIAVVSLLSLAVLAAAKYDRKYRVLLVTAGIALITGMVAILIWPTVVVTAAERRASGRAYCLMVAHGGNYRTAENLLDLTPLVMRGHEGGRSAANFHGEMIVGESRRNWSYKNFDFSGGAGDNKPPNCTAEIGFARNLPLF